MPMTVRFRLIVPDRSMRSRKRAFYFEIGVQIRSQNVACNRLGVLRGQLQVDRNLRLQALRSCPSSTAAPARHARLDSRFLSVPWLPTRCAVMSGQVHALGVVAQVPVGKIDGAADLGRARITGHGGIDRERARCPLTARLQHRIGQSRIELAA